MENHILTVHADIFRGTPVKPVAKYQNEKKGETCLAAKTGGEKKEPENSIRRPEDVIRIESKSEINFESDIMLVLVIVEGKKCPKCNFLATNKTLLDDHTIEKHFQKNSMKAIKNKSRQRGKVSKKKRRYI
jgi:hypothetical protein